MALVSWVADALATERVMSPARRIEMVSRDGE